MLKFHHTWSHWPIKKNMTSLLQSIAQSNSKPDHLSISSFPCLKDTPECHQWRWVLQHPNRRVDIGLVQPLLPTEFQRILDFCCRIGARHRGEARDGWLSTDANSTEKFSRPPDRNMCPRTDQTFKMELGNFLTFEIVFMALKLWKVEWNRQQGKSKTICSRVDVFNILLKIRLDLHR